MKIKKLKIFLMFISFLFAITAHANYLKVTQKQANLQAQNPLEGLPDPVLKAAINAYEWAVRNHVATNPGMLTIVDYNMPSYKKRMWVIDLNNDHLIMHMHVSQGRDSGKVYATRFSNANNSHESSLGIYTTDGGEFYGEFGKSIRLRGWEPGINSNAYKRAILVHSEWYVTPGYIQKMGRAGRTWGCFAVNPDHVSRLIYLISGGSVLFVYATPEKYDPLVNHHLTYAGKTIYEKIKGINSNPVVRFFETL